MADVSVTSHVSLSDGSRYPNMIFIPGGTFRMGSDGHYPEEQIYDPRQLQIKTERKGIKGGSHLCTPNYCRRFRPAVHRAEAVDTSTTTSAFAAC